MIKTNTLKATPQQYVDLAKSLYFQGASPEGALTWAKSLKYTVNGVHYNTFTRVLSAMNMLIDINNAILSGSLKATKAKGLTLPTKPTKSEVDEAFPD